MSVEVRPAADRFVTRAPGVDTRHCFSFGPHYDPAQVGHGALVVCDEHRLDSGAGFAPHPHRDVEVVSWVLEGELVHADASGDVVVPAGAVQRMSAGTGVVHAERAGSDGTRFVQCWLLPAVASTPPSYERLVVDPERLRDGLVPVVSGLGHAGALGLGAPAALHVGRLSSGASLRLPSADRLHVLVVRGAVELDGRPLAHGDSARLTAEAPRVTAATAAEVLVWELPDPVRQE